MAIIDIRDKSKKDEITTIRFGEEMNDSAQLVFLFDEGVRLQDAEGYGACGIASKEDALNLIKALEKAVELGWFDK